MTDAELEQIEAGANAATPGPWVYTVGIGPGVPVNASVGALAKPGDFLCFGDHVHDALFACAARSDVPALVAEVRRLQKAIRLARDADYERSERD